MSLTPDVVGLDRYEREQERADPEAEARAEAAYDREVLIQFGRYQAGLLGPLPDEVEDDPEEDVLYDEDMTRGEYEYDRDEDYLRERADVERHGGVW